MLRSWFRVWLAVVTAAAVVLVAGTPSASAAADQVVTYSIDTRGELRGDLEQFTAIADTTLRDPRGWSLGGAIEFRRVPAGGDLTLWLAGPAAVEAAAPICSSGFSCRAGRDVFINDERWRTATESWDRSLAEYRKYVILHEVGHWLGLKHENCAGPGRSAPVMQQQSKSLQGCEAAVWPSISERDRVAAGQGVAVRPTPVEARYRGAGAEGGALGPPVTSEWPVVGGATQRFSGGEILFSERTGAQVISGDTLARYRELDGVRGPLGFPTSDVVATADGRVSTFAGSDGGAIFWTELTGAHEVYGTIFDRYTALGGDKSELGHPTSGELADGDGRRSNFEHGYIEWSLADGPRVVMTD